MPTRIRGISEVVLNVHEIGASLKFYRDVLGLTVISPLAMQDRVYLEAGGAPTGMPQIIVLMTLGPETSGFVYPRQMDHLALEISPGDFDGELERLKGLGYDVRVGRHPVVPAKTMCINDPDGNRVALICKR